MEAGRRHNGHPLTDVVAFLINGSFPFFTIYHIGTFDFNSRPWPLDTSARHPPCISPVGHGPQRLCVATTRCVEWLPVNSAPVLSMWPSAQKRASPGPPHSPYVAPVPRWSVAQATPHAAAHSEVLLEDDWHVMETVSHLPIAVRELLGSLDPGLLVPLLVPLWSPLLSVGKRWPGGSRVPDVTAGTQAPSPSSVRPAPTRAGLPGWWWQRTAIAVGVGSQPVYWCGHAARYTTR